MFARYQFGWSGFTSVTDGRYRLIKSTPTHDELYDLEQDESERTNLARESTGVKAALNSALEELLAESPSPKRAEISPEDRDRFEALGDVGALTDPPSIADGPENVAVVEAYRAAVDRDVAREWPQAIEVLQKLLRDDPQSADAWMRLGMVADRSGRHELAYDAYRRVTVLRPDDAGGHLGVATVLWRLRRLEEAWQQGRLAASLAREDDRRLRGSLHELLARIAVGRRDSPAARLEADLAQQAENGRPVPEFIEGRLLQDQRRWDAALESFERAVTVLEKSNGRRVADLHFYAAETLVRLERYAEAEYQFLEELRRFPLNVRARAELAGLYQSMQRTDEATAALAAMVRLAPTPESFLLAARMSQAFGNPRQAAAFRAEGQRRSGSSPATHH